ncbi:DoxX family protein [Aliiroseovarius sp. Z3]|uniref:DoxX family protein n=1 Tax=Aliiroseovarius sp. Z3 TaxID=2811402 RepID=UPI0023B2628A|nr:DoxX family protein [Aliiroseovarius sp. Z3]MDE9449797.1 DoxX family protein [Aliiroseovarius sp. Z3]
MNIVLWILQAFLALHTAIGAGWKLFNSEQTVPTLAAIPGAVWMTLIPLELLCAAGLVIPVISPSLGWLVPVAAIGIAVEMLVFSGVHLRAGAEDNGPTYYWLAVATVAAVIALGRSFVAPH